MYVRTNLEAPCPTAACLHRCADFVILNKADMMNPAMMDSLTAIVESLNPLAQVREGSAFGVDIDRKIWGNWGVWS